MDFTREGVTAMAHPGSVKIGLTHGVFVLDPKEIDSIDSKTLTPRKCLRFLHKPTKDTMEVLLLLVISINLHSECRGTSQRQRF